MVISQKKVGKKPRKTKIPGRVTHEPCLLPVQASLHLLTKYRPNQIPSALWCTLLVPLLQLLPVCLMIKRAPDKRKIFRGLLPRYIQKNSEEICWIGYHGYTCRSQSFHFRAHQHFPFQFLLLLYLCPCHFLHLSQLCACITSYKIENISGTLWLQYFPFM